MSYSRGVLIQNFNEDRFGSDLQSMPRQAMPPKISVSHTVHHWKVPEREEKPDSIASQNVDRHLLFGHAGDMRDPRTSMQVTNFGTAQQYFMQNPKHVTHVGHLSADGFTTSDHPKQLAAVHTSHLATAKKENWGDLRQSHSLPANERFMSETKRSFQGVQDNGIGHGFRVPRVYGEFTRTSDKQSMARSNPKLQSVGMSSLKK